LHHRHLHSFPTRRSSDLRKSTKFDAEESRRCRIVLFARFVQQQEPRSSGLYIDPRGGRPTSRASFFFLQRDRGERKRKMARVLRSEEHTSELQSLTNLVC